MLNITDIPSLDFEAGMTIALSNENVAGLGCVAAGVVIGIAINIAR